MGREDRFYIMEMSSLQNGEFSVSVSDTDYQVMLIVVSVPGYFKGFQTYGYQVKITKQ